MPAARAHRSNRDIRRWIYGGLDLGFAVLYVIAMAFAARSRFAEGRVIVGCLPAFAIMAAVGTLVGGKRGWRIACSGCVALCVMAAYLLLALCVDAAYLAGVYGSFGKAAASFAIVTGLLVIELVGLVPALQLKWLRSRAGRRAFGMLG
jgi:hypothetical protein